MNTTIKTTNYEITPDIEKLVHEKLSHVERLVPSDVESLAEVELELVEERKNGHAVYRAEVNLTVDGTLHRASSTRRSLQNALSDVKQELQKVLRRVKGRNESMVKRGGRLAKKMLRGFNS